MYAVRVYDPEGFYDDYYFYKIENAIVFLRKKAEDFIQLQIDRGYNASNFGYNTYEEMLKDCVKHGGMTDVAYLFKIVMED